MKLVIISLAFAGLASAAPANAQILSSRIPAPSTSTSVDGSWRVVGRDNSGNTIYERRTQDRNGNIVVQRARRNSNGSMSIISTNTIGNSRNDRNNRNCDYNRSTNSIGDIIFGRSNDTYCEDNGNREDGGWYQVGRGRDNNSIYERRTYDRNGNLVIQRARRNSNGSFSIISSRRANDDDRQWRKAQKRDDKEWRKEHKRDEKDWKKSNKNDDKHDRGNHR
jgi:hypothetical protein